jgi:hypothetical protein
VSEDAIAKLVTCGPDIDRHVAAIQAFVDAGFDHVYIHQVGPNQEAFLETFARDVLPRFESTERRSEPAPAGQA